MEPQVDSPGTSWHNRNAGIAQGGDRSKLFFREAVTDPPQVAALMYAALVLMIITLLVNLLGSWVIARASHKLKGLR